MPTISGSAPTAQLRFRLVEANTVTRLKPLLCATPLFDVAWRSPSNRSEPLRNLGGFSQKIGLHLF